MKQLLRFLFIFIVIINPLFADNENDDFRDAIGISFFHPRSNVTNKAQESAGMANLITWGYDECSRGVAWTTGAYSKSFAQRDIGKYLFFNGTDTMRTGTAAGPGIDIFAENFLLNDNFNSAVTAHPQATNKLIDINLFMPLDVFCPGFYLLIHAPYASTTWSVDLKETVSTKGTVIEQFNLGNPVAEPAPFNSMIAAWNGQGTFGDVKQPLQFGRIDGKKSKKRFSDIEIALGCILLEDDYNYFSINVRGIIPMGNRPKGKFLFEPITGNGHYGEVGFGILGNFYLWECSCQEFLTIFLNANIYTMLNSKQMRTFDLKNNGKGSRYLLFKRFSNETYAGEIVRGPNILTLPIHTHNRAEGDIVLMIEYTRCGLILDAGYNLWGRTRDHIKVIGTIPENTYGIAGLTGTSPANMNKTASATLIDGTNASDFDPSGPIFISNRDINIESAAHPGAFSHSFFGNISYIWDCNLQPFIGIGTQIEFSGTNKSFKMWHLWGKLGLSF